MELDRLEVVAADAGVVWAADVEVVSAVDAEWVAVIDPVPGPVATACVPIAGPSYRTKSVFPATRSVVRSVARR